jgi:phospholipid/cholesterol/gamma-HCH transport system ATP-binding protein
VWSSVQEGKTVIVLKNVRKSFGPVEVLRDISLTLREGERASLLGPGGCGKSTILKIALGLLAPDSGTVSLRGHDMVAARESQKREILRRVGMAFQQGALFDFMTVRENLLFAMENMTELDSMAMDQRIKELLAGVKLGRTESMFPWELSGGMQRRVGIARALCTDPQVAIFDEPTSGLDPVTSTIILNMILELGGRSKGHALLIATSNVEIAIRFAERIILVNNGEVVADGPWRDLLLDGSEWVRHFLGVRLIGLDLDYVRGLQLPEPFIAQHWSAP